ncbi:SusE domain-containing protein [Flavobacterium sp. MAHUQ-51]|uniref:SusE domain-containing protein n=1 Tax=Flavobacterium sp. GCM10022190 TaxID=3252639 RepID=UPI003624093F
MKKYYYILFNFVAILLLMGCGNDEYALKVGFEAPKELITPINNEFIVVNLESNTNTLFQWAKSSSQYGGVVLYEVVFDKVNGDFSNPIATMMSSGGGGNNYLSLTPKQLVNLAKTAGIGIDSEGQIKWKVYASQGGERKVTTQENILRIKRPSGISDIPNDLYVYGDGFETKTLATAMKFKKIEDGVFEIYAALTSGSINLSNSINDGKMFYGLDSQNKLTESETALAIPVSGTGKAYRIVVDFNLLKIVYTEIQSIKMIRTWQYNLGDLVYVGNHKFEVKNISLPYFYDWGYPEERYRFRVTTNAGTEIWGSYHNDAMNASNIPGLTAFNVQPDGRQPSEYYNVYNLADIPSPGQNADWTGMYKLPLGSVDKIADVTINMSPSGSYKHTVSVK